jgi:hypothetical protein
MNNVATADSLVRLAEVYVKPENAALVAPHVSIHTDTKQELISILRAIGGKFTKHPGDYYLTFKSVQLPGVHVNICRDRVCKKVVTWECEPLLSPEDLVEVEELAA